MTYFIIFIIIIIILLIIIKKFRKPKKNTILLYSGANGSGKSFNMTEDSRKAYRLSLRKWKSINKPNIFYFSWWLSFIPYFKNKRLKNELYGLDKPLLLSSYPIYISKFRKIISKPLTNDIMFLEKSVPLNSIFVIDEFSGWISQFEYNEKFSNTLNDHLQKFRHYHGNLSRLFVADQCSNNIPIQIRYRANQAIVYKETKHYFKLFHISKYKCIDLTDDIKSIEILDDNKADTDDNVCKTFRFGLCRNYDDRAYSNRYYYVDKNDKNSKYIKSKLKVNQTLKKPSKSKDKTYVDLDNVIELDK